MDPKLLFCTVGMSLALVSCFDDKYNLDDIDTTSRVTVDDLIIPVNFDDVYLSNIIKIEDDSDIRIVEIDNKRYYAVVRNGSFSSDDIIINAPVATAPTINPQTATLVKVDDRFTIEKMGEDFTFSCDNVDKSIVSIKSVGVEDLKFDVTFLTPQIVNGKYEHLTMLLPKGMTGTSSAGSYDAASGEWTIDELSVVAGEAEATFTATSIDFTANDFSYENPSFEFTSEFSILGGYLTADNAPESANFEARFNLSELKATAVSGEIEYEIEGMNIETVSLDNLPNFLQGDRTDITLVNPLICMQTSNPVADDKLSFDASIDLTAVRNEEMSAPYSSETFTIGYNKGVDGPYTFVLSPETPTFVPEPFDNDFTPVKIPGIGSILAGKGLPDAIDITVNHPRIPRQSVENFALGREIDGVEGTYELFAPFALKNSTIVYTDTKDGWNDDVEDLTITSLVLTALGTNNTPLNAEVSVIPIDVEGNPIPGVTIVPAILPSDAVNANISLSVTKTDGFTGLDGVRFEATVTSHDSDVLSPDMTLSFNEVRVKVNGFYQKKL